MRNILGITVAFLLCGLLSVIGAESYSLADGSTISGDVVSFNNNGVILKTGPETYTSRLPWMKFSQDGLKELAKNPKIKPFAGPFIEPPPTAHKKPVQVHDVVRLAHPKSGSLFGALFTSSVGIVVMLLIYAASIYAGYEISVFRARPPGVGIGLAAVLPVLGPIILLSMPTQAQAAPVEEIPVEQQAVEEPQRFTLPGVEAPVVEPVGAPPQEQINIGASGFSGAPPPAETPTETFQRGQFMFNRRFFETKFPGFFGIARSEADRGKILLVKTPGALLTVQRISRISSSDAHFEVVQGGQQQEVVVPFAEIQQIQLKHNA